MILSKKNIKNVPGQDAVEVPHEALFNLPEKVLQFGTGVLLRGLPDYFIDKANKQGKFNGRIVVVKSTSTGGVDAFEEQDGLYTVCIRGIEGTSKTEENIINASISRVLSAKTEWQEIMECATNPEMQLVISNTTEVGIALSNDSIHDSPPESFPGKLLAFLYTRFNFFDGDKEKGMVIIPTELIVDNAIKLKDILLQLAKQNELEEKFIQWLINHTYFCNSLVDRIVPGKLPVDQQKEIENTLGYEDKLMIMAEVYRLWAIETSEDEAVAALPFRHADKGIVIASNIDVFRELKLRLLNGSHTFTCGLAHLSGFKTVKEAMDNEEFANFISDLMTEEIVPAIVSDRISKDEATEFASKVIDRYRNPHIEHQWLSICVQYSSKMRMRNLPVIQKFYQQYGATPERMTLGFAAFLVFMKTRRNKVGSVVGYANGQEYVITDDNMSVISSEWNTEKTEAVVKKILANENLWHTDLSKLPGFAENVIRMIHFIEKDGALSTIKGFARTKVTVES